VCHGEEEGHVRIQLTICGKEFTTLGSRLGPPMIIP
jgi:hypothetical protein